jgi:hypothetical protein
MVSGIPDSATTAVLLASLPLVDSLVELELLHPVRAKTNTSSAARIPHNFFIKIPPKNIYPL